MGKRLVTALFTLTIILASIIVYPIEGVNGQNANQVSGHITANTTWTKNSSPYNLGSDLFVDPGITLTVEPGVTVNYNGHNLYVNGTLNAQGTETQKIQFNAGKKWDGIGPEYSTVLDGLSKLSYCTITGRVTLNGDGEISHSFIDGEISVLDGTPTISNNWINGSMLADGIGLYSNNRLAASKANAIIRDNQFTFCYRAIAVTAGDEATIVRNYFHNNSWAIVSGTSGYCDTSGAQSAIINNTVKDNEGGIAVIGKIPAVITGNNLENNQQFGLSLAATKFDENASRVWGTSDQIAEYNWWGTTNSEAISQAIIDHADNSPSGIVTFTPCLTEPNPQAMPNGNLPAPIITPPLTPAPVTQKIARVQFYSNGAILSSDYIVDNGTGQLKDNSFLNNSKTFNTTATLNRMPKQGNVLVAAIGYSLLANGPTNSNVSSISQTGVTWTRQVSQNTSAYGQVLEIWLGIVGANAKPEFSISFGGSANIQSFVIAYDLCEYSGVATVNPLDQTASNSGFGSTSDTGQTPMTTKSNELWVGAIFYYMSATQTGARNGFEQIGGDPTYTGGRMSTALLEKIVNQRGAANTGTEDTASPSNWGGAIATFFAADQTADTNPSPTPVVDNAPQLQFSCQSEVSSTIRVNIKGSLTVNDVGIANEPILFAYSVNNGRSWNDLTTVTTDGNGKFTILWTPAATGNYLIVAKWAGNNAYPALDTTVNFAIAPYDAGSFFSINSNSTLSTLSFDSTKKQLSFTVSGPLGSTGYVEIYIPKTLMSDASGLEVKLDGAKLDYTLGDQGGAWLITFTYHHSTHQVTMNLNALTGGGGFDSGLVGWVLIAAIIIPLAAAITYIATKKGKDKS